MENPPPPSPIIRLPEKPAERIRKHIGLDEPLPPPPPHKKDTTDIHQIGKKYSKLIGQYLDIKPVRKNKPEMDHIYKPLSDMYDKWDNTFRGSEQTKPLPPPPMTPLSRMTVYYRQNAKTVEKDIALLNRVAQRYEERLEEYSKISPVSDGNLKYVYKRATIIYNNWHKIFEETEDVSALASLPTSPEEKIKAYKNGKE
jgi:hypothetical protein